MDRAGAHRAAHDLPLQQRRAMRAIETCSTAALGGHVEGAANTTFTRIFSNSCRNRHCPKCQGNERTKWLESRTEAPEVPPPGIGLAELLPVQYFHVVFTIPKEIARITYNDKKIVYGILFRRRAARGGSAPGPRRNSNRPAHSLQTPEPHISEPGGRSATA